MNEILDNEFFPWVKLFGVLFFVIALVLSDKGIFKKYTSYIILIFLLIVSVNLIRGDEFNIDSLRRVISTPSFFMPYLVPFILLILISQKDIPLILNGIYISGILYLIMIVLNWSNLTGTSFDMLELHNKFLSYSVTLLLFLLPLFNNKKKLVIVAIYLISFLFALYHARRNQIFTLSLSGIAAFYLYHKNSKFSVRTIMMAIFFTIIGCVAVLFQYTYNDLFVKKITQRLYEDTRSGVVENFWDDMTPIDLILGRGISGTYYCPTLSDVDTDINDMRGGIETGFLDIILDIGYIGLFIFLAMLLLAVYRGTFNSNNMLAKGFAAYLFIYLLELYPAGNPLFSLRFALVFIAISFCFNEEICQMDDEQLKQCLNENNI
ncbi:MAG: hypothetical protein RR202_12070 [Bacteroidales bacterium]